jgi:hypothetical protein
MTSRQGTPRQGTPRTTASQETETEDRTLHRKLGLYTGLFTGGALALGAWAPQAITLSLAHVGGNYLALLLGSLCLVMLGGLAGWLASWRASALWGALVWFLAAGLMIWTVGHLPYEVRNLTLWLADLQLWGLPIYAFSAAARARLLMASFFVVLCLTILGLMQNYRLENIASETDKAGRLSARAWFSLLIPLPLVFAAGLASDNLVNSPERTAFNLVQEAIHTGRTYPGDLFELSMKGGVNYNAIAGVREQMSDTYTLSSAEVGLGATSNIIVVAHFDNGAWINCRVTADQLFHCYDASPPYRQGFAALLTTGETPEECRACTIKVGGKLRDWLLTRQEKWQLSPHLTRLTQQGSYVLMRADSPSGDYGLECLFHGTSPVTLEQCEETGG